jgi:hypothetical protein
MSSLRSMCVMVSKVQSSAILGDEHRVCGGVSDFEMGEQFLRPPLADVLVAFGEAP